MLSRYTLLSTSTVQVLNGDGPTRYPGIVLLGGIGSGKTAIIEQLVANSCFHDSSAPSSSSNPSKHPDPQGLSNGFNSSPTSTLHGTQANRTGAPARKTSVGSMSVGGAGGGGGVGVVAGNLSASVSNLNYASLQNLGSQVVAFHMCQADNNITCMVPDFVHSLSAYLTRAPQLQAYRDLLTQVGSAFGLFMVTPFLLLCLFTVTPFLLPSVCLRSHPVCCPQSVYGHTLSAAFSLFTVTPCLLLSVCLRSQLFCCPQSVYSHTLSAAFSLFMVTTFLLPSVCLQSHPVCCSQSVYGHNFSAAFSLFMVTPGLLLSVCLQSHPFYFQSVYGHILSAAFSLFTVTPFVLSVSLQSHPFCFQSVYGHTLSAALSLFTVTPFLLSASLQSHCFCSQSLYSHTFSAGFSLFTVIPFLLSVCLQSHPFYFQSVYSCTLSALIMFTVTHFLFAVSL